MFMGNAKTWIRSARLGFGMPASTVGTAECGTRSRRRFEHKRDRRRRLGRVFAEGECGRGGRREGHTAQRGLPIAVAGIC